MFAKINNLSRTYPVFDATKVKDKNYFARYTAECKKADMQRNDLILKFYLAYPKNGRAQALMPGRWASMDGMKLPPAEINRDVDSILKTHPAPVVQSAGMYWRAELALRKSLSDGKKQVEQFARAFPSDPRVKQLRYEQIHGTGVHRITGHD